METSATAPDPTPERADVIPDSYAVHVGAERIDVWQYRITISDPDGAWHFVETLDREKDPKLSMDQASPMPPTAAGYWIYSRTYDCELDCE
ncbi:hypothetical protein [Halobellus litoreus]|uniref:Uncharacterized protein n=1 Tax=Halobellus litoreus TaxID=755310 RepID=A0ABD6DS81_9EURY|nr:hypothetical protein [Halobellus litoreus]